MASETLDLSDNKLTGQCRKPVLRLTGFIIDLFFFAGVLLHVFVVFIMA